MRPLLEQPIKARAVLLTILNPAAILIRIRNTLLTRSFSIKSLLYYAQDFSFFSLSKLYSHNKMTFTSVKLFAKLSSIPTILLLATLAILSVVAFCTLFLPRHKVSSRAPKQTSHQFYRLGALSFFTSRWNFYKQAISESVSGNFSFYLGKYFVVGLSGQDARRVFFENRSLNLTEGCVV